MQLKVGRTSIEEQSLRQLLSRVKSGEASVEDALSQLSHLPYEDIGFAKIDHHRALRRGFPEVVLGQGKTPEQVVAISECLAQRSQRVLVTRVDSKCASLVKRKIPDAVYHAEARAITINRLKKPGSRAGIVVLSGGTSDQPVAEEAAVTAELMGNKIDRFYDVGVSGIHRLLYQLPRLRKAQVVVAVAGMEGALPGIVSGLVAAPVIAVPTSIGYGASFGGIAPLLTMLNSCSSGVAVVNIDNGFGAGYLAALINRK